LGSGTIEGRGQEWWRVGVGNNGRDCKATTCDARNGNGRATTCDVRNGNGRATTCDARNGRATTCDARTTYGATTREARRQKGGGRGATTRDARKRAAEREKLLWSALWRSEHDCNARMTHGATTREARMRRKGGATTRDARKRATERDELLRSALRGRWSSVHSCRIRTTKLPCEARNVHLYACHA
jgi:hypothetical protein